MNSKDDALSSAIVKFLFEHFEIGGGLRLADQTAQRRDVLRLDVFHDPLRLGHDVLNRLLKMRCVLVDVEQGAAVAVYLKVLR